MFQIKFKILVFYSDAEALKEYLQKFYELRSELYPAVVKKMQREVSIETECFYIRCIKCHNFSDSFRGFKAHLIAIQEELTWYENWHQIKNCIIEPMRMSPIDIQIFDGISPYDTDQYEQDECV